MQRPMPPHSTFLCVPTYVGGCAGEGQLMSWDEHIMLIAHTVNTFGRHLQVIGNTGSNSTREALHATEQGFAVGMDAALQINPYYGKTSLDGLIAHFSAVLNEGPTIVYNVPSRTGTHAQMHCFTSVASHTTLCVHPGSPRRYRHTNVTSCLKSCKCHRIACFNPALAACTHHVISPVVAGAPILLSPAACGMLAGQDVPDHVVQRLSCHANWLGVKECTGNNRIQNYADQGIMCWSGNDDEAHDSRHDHGGQVGLAPFQSSMAASLISYPNPLFSEFGVCCFMSGHSASAASSSVKLIQIAWLSPPSLPLSTPEPYADIATYSTLVHPPPSPPPLHPTSSLP